MISICLWHWGRRYGAVHIQRMKSMLERQLHLPHKIVCITDRPEDVPDGCDVFNVKHTIQSHGDFKCIRRMWLYGGKPSKPSKHWAGDLGDRLLQLDLDMVLTDNVTPLFDRPEPLVIWRGDSAVKPNRPHGWAYNATVMLLTPGARRDVYDRYLEDPQSIHRQADADGWDVATNSDQAIATYLLKDGRVDYWTNDDGIYAYRGIAGPDGSKDQGLPAGCRIVSFHGRSGARHPGDPVLQKRSPWILEHWR